MTNLLERCVSFLNEEGVKVVEEEEAQEFKCVAMQLCQSGQNESL